MSQPSNPPLGHGGGAPDDQDRPGTAIQVVLAAEHGQVRTRRVPVERIRVAKRIVTETRLLPVEVRREELVVERLPVPDSGDATPPAPAADTGLVLVLHEQVPEVTVRTVPTELVRVVRDTVTDTVQVTARLHREQAEVVTDPTP